MVIKVRQAWPRLPRLLTTVREMMVKILFRVLAWASVGFIAYSTLVPIALRPHAGGVNPDYERFAAYAVASSLMVFAYPYHSLRVAIGGVMIAIVLEVSQLAVPGRDARVADALLKIAGALSGTAVATLGIRWMLPDILAKIMSD